MRQGQQNRRGRGRNNNRKSQNPLTRSFESAGPDVKLRGTPSHIAEKYVSLARDALSSGDPVLAENYLQHAEHYNRIILSVREQQLSQGGMDPFNGGVARTHTLGGSDDGEQAEFSEDEGDELSGNNPQAAGASEGQPPYQNQRNFDQQPSRFDRPQRHDNRDRHDRSDHRQNSRHDRGDRNDNARFDRGDRNDRQSHRGDHQDFRGDRRSSYNQHGDQAAEGNGFRRRDRFQGNSQVANGFDREAPANGFAPPPVQPQPSVSEKAPAAAAPTPEQEQPAFLRRPVRRPRREAAEKSEAPAPAVTEDQD